MSAEQIGFAFILLGLFIVIGKWVRVYTPLLQQLFLPSSIIAGLIALLVGPEVLGRLMTTLTSEDHLLSQGIINLATLDVWEALPGLFINIVFATLFLGKSLPSLNKVWHIGGPQVAMGQMVSWGQYVIGLLLVLLILTPFFGVNPLAGALIEISFVGGHGTAAGLGNTFAELGFAEGQDLAIGLATVGILTGVIVGIILINWGARKGHGQYVGGAQKLSSTGRNGIVELDNRDSGADMRQHVLNRLNLYPYTLLMWGSLFLWDGYC